MLRLCGLAVSLVAVSLAVVYGFTAKASDPVPVGPNVLPPIPSLPPGSTPVPSRPMRTAPALPAPPASNDAPVESAPAPAPLPSTTPEPSVDPQPAPGPSPYSSPRPARDEEEYIPYGYGYDKKKYHAGSTMENLRSKHSYRHGSGYQPDAASDPALYITEGGMIGGNYPNPVGSPYHYGPGWSYAGGNAYEVHFGPGFYRSGEYGHLRFPYYDYRRPWFHPGPATYVRDTNLHW